MSASGVSTTEALCRRGIVSRARMGRSTIKFDWLLLESFVLCWIECSCGRFSSSSLLLLLHGESSLSCTAASQLFFVLNTSTLLTRRFPYVRRFGRFTSIAVVSWSLARGGGSPLVLLDSRPFLRVKRGRSPLIGNGLQPYSLPSGCCLEAVLSASGVLPML